MRHIFIGFSSREQLSIILKLKQCHYCSSPRLRKFNWTLNTKLDEKEKTIQLDSPLRLLCLDEAIMHERPPCFGTYE